MQTLILAGASVRSLAESAIRGGFSPICLDLFGDADLPRGPGAISDENLPRRVNGFPELVQALANLDRQIPLIWTGGLENQPQLLQQLTQSRPVAGLAVPELRRARDPLLVQQILTDAGCPAAQIWPGTAVPAVGNWLIKPRRGAGGQGIRRLSRSAGTDFLSEDCYLQEFVDGWPLSATYVSDCAGTRLIGACRQLIGEPVLGGSDFQFCGNLGPLNLPPLLRRQLESCGQALTAGCGLRGCFGVDFVVQDGLPVVVEVNPRITASHELFEFSSGHRWNPVACQLHAFGMNATADASRLPPLNSVQPPSTADCGAFARLILYARCDFQITPAVVQQLLSVCRLPGTADTDVWLADIPQAELIPAGTPVCSVYLRIRSKRREAVAAGAEPRGLSAVQAQLDHLSFGQNFCLRNEFRRIERFSEILQTDNKFDTGRIAVFRRNLLYGSGS